MLKLSDNPPILAPWAKSIGDLDGRWWVAHTRSRFEKAFAWDLERRHIGYFLPMVLRVTISGGRKRRLMMPLFSSYIFLCGQESDRHAAMTTNRVCAVLEVADQQGLIGELTALHAALEGKAELDPFPFAVAGRRCRVTAGPFGGIEGVVVQRKSVTRLVLGVSILAQGAAMEIDADLLEPMD
jgi:transcriptional antiterminator RfaH